MAAKKKNSKSVRMTDEVLAYVEQMDGDGFNQKFENMVLYAVDEIPVLGVVNWFIPFDICASLLDAWLVVVIAYYAYKNIHNILDWIAKLKALF